MTVENCETCRIGTLFFLLQQSYLLVVQHQSRSQMSHQLALLKWRTFEQDILGVFPRIHIVLIDCIFWRTLTRVDAVGTVPEYTAIEFLRRLLYTKILCLGEMKKDGADAERPREAASRGRGKS